MLSAENDLSHPRLGLAVGKRYVPKAVNRNYVKRAIREWFRHHQKNLQPVDFMVTIQQPIDDPTNIKQWLARVATETR